MHDVVAVAVLVVGSLVVVGDDPVSAVVDAAAVADVVLWP